MNTRRTDAGLDGALAGCPTEVLDSTRVSSRTAAATRDSELVRKVMAQGDRPVLGTLENRQTIGEGGVGRVQSAFDPILGRTLAIKTLRPEFRDREAFVQRLVREARATAQLEHPGVVAVHSLGHDERDGVYFTMRELQGVTLRGVLDGLRAGDPGLSAKYTQARLISIFRRVCETVAYAHSRGVIHRDLKPENVIIGDYGEVVILDWGLVRLLDDPPEAAAAVDIALLPNQSTSLTLDGEVSGTPKYMSPEQARGENSAVDERSDVFSLGTLLYELLTLVPPFSDTETRELLRRVAAAEFERPRRAASRRHVPRDLEAICLKAMALEKGRRYPGVQAMIDDLFAFQDGRLVSARRARLLLVAWKYAMRHAIGSAMMGTVVGATVVTLAVVWAVQRNQYIASMGKAERSIAMARTALGQAGTTMSAIESERAARSGGAKSANERQFELRVREEEATAANHLDLAVLLATGVPSRYRDHPAVRAVLRSVYEIRADYSRKTTQYEPLRQWIGLLRMAVAETGSADDSEVAYRIRMAELALRGDGVLSMRTQPLPATVSLHRLGEDLERGVIAAAVATELGSTPVAEVTVPRGDYLAVLHVRGQPAILYPLEVLHGERLDVEVAVPRSVPSGMVYVPAGRFKFGEMDSPHLPQRRITVPGFFIRRLEVTFDEYLEFWLTRRDPRERDEYLSRVGFTADTILPVPAWDERGQYIGGIAGNGPLVGVSRTAADAYCRWLAERTGFAYRLPTAEEWEKAARGADGRTYPWGNGYFPTYAFILENEEARCKYGLWAPPGAFPFDQSVYGVMDMAGNVREWTASTFVPGVAQFQIRGSSSTASQRYLPVDHASDAPFFPSDVGFRYVLSLADWERPQSPPE